MHEVLLRNHRWDFGNYLKKLVVAVAQGLDGKDRDSPFFPLLRRARETPTGYFKRGDGFFDAGRVYEERGDLKKAFTCYENAIFHERSETEQVHVPAFRRVEALAKQFADPLYLAYLEQVHLPTPEDESDWNEKRKS
jgi:hypothetical protein